ncbi:MAG: ABC transporter ATP-binding protein [Bacteroidales bacterium]|nr:ABC transporter ATP-binding protein [Bacteroidales bacterium]
MELLLSVSNLSVEFKHGDAYHRAVQDVSFNVYRGRTLGIVGESGSGKSVSCMSLMHLLPSPPARIASGRAMLQEGDGCVELMGMSEEEIRTIRGRRIAMIFQEPMTSLNPVQRCGDQVVEMLRLHETVDHDEARRRVIALFEEVQLPRPEKIFESFPHEISGGQKQRVMIAMALICHPDIIIADEPTTALDVIAQKAILDLMREMQRRYNIGIIFITHDLGVMAQVADDLAVMYRGSIVEQGSAAQILAHPQHPYTQGLLACRPPLDHRPDRLPTVADFLDPENPARQRRSNPTAAAPQTEKSLGSTSSAHQSDTPLIAVHDLCVDFPLKRNLFGKPTQILHAVKSLTFDIHEGETLGLVGGSGCGKTTLGRTLLRLIEKTSGSILYRGQPLDKLSSQEMRRLRSKLQIIFQDPYSSLNPHLTVGQAIMEPLIVHHRLGSDAERREAVLTLMQQVGLSAEHFDRYPHEFSGGQRQRVCIARALILEPELVVCDESVSALDVSVQAQVLNLLSDLKQHYHYTYLFITHDLSVMHYMADRIIVMQNGEIVEQGATDQLFAHPQHPYTQQLVDAIPRI